MDFRRRGWTVAQEENGKYIPLDLAGKGGKPVPGFSFPGDVPDRIRKIREQAMALRRIADRLDRKASELEKTLHRGKVIDLLRRHLRKAASSEPA